MSKKRPTTFDIFGRTFTIKYTEDLIQHDSCYGLWRPDKGEVTIQTNLDRGLEDHTLWHELTHAILDSIGNEELSKNEVFVDLFGAALHQVVKTLR